MSHDSSDPNSAKQGFALVLSLFLMSFVLVILVSMVALVQVETSNSSSSLSRLQAQESARLGLMIAIGELQKHAGPDQRVTARADILGDGNYAPEAKFWTGVWDTTNPAAAPVWLVSGQTPNPSTIPTETSRMLGPGTVGSQTNQFCEAPLVSIADTNNRVISKIAWWASDEGVKASYGVVDHIDQIDSSFYTAYAPLGLDADEQRQMTRQISPAGINRAVFFGTDTNFAPGETEDILSPTVAEKVTIAKSDLSRISTTVQASLMPGVTIDELKNSYHDTTLLARSVLTDTRDGGLKIDLSNQSYTNSSASPPINDDLKNYLWSSLPDSSGAIPLQGIEPSKLSDFAAGAFIPTTPPIITEFTLYFVVSGISSNSRTAKAFLRFEAEIWSPYGFRHNFTGSSSSNTPEIIVEFENLPDLTLSFFDKDSDAYTNSKIITLETIQPKFELDLTDTHKSGEIRKIIADWPVNKSSDKSNFYYSDLWSWDVDDPSVNSQHRNKSFPDGDWIHYSAASSEVNLLIKNTDGQILQRIANIPYGAIDTDFGFYVSSPSSLDESDAPIVFQYRMLDDRNELESWLTEEDPRSIELDLEDENIIALIDLNDIDGDGLGDADIPSSVRYSNLDFFHGQLNNNFYRIFDIPATIPYSLGILQHIQIKGAPPFAIGNSWGNDKNALFDDYFISGIPQASSSVVWDPAKNNSRLLPNHHLEIYDPESHLSADAFISSETAEHLLIQGGFNINSTSEKAWESILSSNTIFDWRYTINKGNSNEENLTRLNLERSFFRLPFSGHIRSRGTSTFGNRKFPFEMYEQETSLEDDYPALDNEEREIALRSTNSFNTTADWKPSLSNANREMTNEAIERLAQEIVRTLKQRTTPFLSLEDFINSGIIQSSIDKTDTNTITQSVSYEDATVDERIPKNASSFLSQADIITALSPKMSARSDTFKIRATGQSINRITGGTTASMTCEALIQRVPTNHPENPANTTGNASGFGRQFIILEVKWLDSSQL